MKLAYKKKRKDAEETADEDYLAKVMRCFRDCVFGLTYVVSHVAEH